MESRKRTPKPRGPEADRLKIEGNWKDAARKAMAKGKPPAPDHPPKKRRTRGK
jgi:hypothetical protein